MHVSVETADGLKRRMTVAVEEERIDKAVQGRLKDLSRTVKLKGFRKGKVPLKVVQQHYGAQVRQDVIGDVLQSSFYEAVEQEKLRPAGAPDFEPKTMEPGKGLEYVATFEVYPEIELADLSKETVIKPVVEITEEDVDAMIENIRRQHMTWEAVDRPAEEGDRVTVDFKGTIEGEPFEGGEGTDMEVVIGEGRLISGFEDGLMGVKAGDEKTLELTFPEDYHAKELAGKPVQFAIKVKKVEAPKLPEVDAEFAKQLGIEDGDLAKMREEIRANMQRELDSKLQGKIKEAVMEVLLGSHDFPVPEALVTQEAQALARQMQENFARQGLKAEDLKLEPAMFRDQAWRRVKLGLLMAEIVKANDLKVDPARVKAKVEEIAAPYEHPEEVVKWYYADPRRLGEVESLVFEEQVVDWVLEQAQVEEKPQTFNEIMNPEAAA